MPDRQGARSARFPCRLRETRFFYFAFSASEGGSLDVTLGEVLIVLVTRIFQDFPVRPECKCPHIFPGLREYPLIINRDLVGNVLVVGSRKSLDYAQLIAMGMTDRIEIALIIEMAALNDERVSLPMANGGTIPLRHEIVGMWTSIDRYNVEHIPGLKEKNHVLVCLNNLNRHRRIHRASQAELETSSGVIVCGRIETLENCRAFRSKRKRAGAFLIPAVYFHILYERMVPNTVQVRFSAWKTRDR